jgi:ribosomal protein S18 acetylase RimI-like enzyme
MDYYLRPATAVDREWLWQTKSRCMRGYIEQTWGVWDEDVQRTSFTDRFELGELNIIVSGGRDVGFIAALNEPTAIQLFNIMVAPEFQNQGVGTAVLLHLQAVARALGVPIRLQVLKVNPARKLYERLGFSVVEAEETPTHYRMIWRPVAAGGGS